MISYIIKLFEGVGLLWVAIVANGASMYPEGNYVIKWQSQLTNFRSQGNARMSYSQASEWAKACNIIEPRVNHWAAAITEGTKTDA